MSGITRINAAILAGTLLVSGAFATLQPQPVQAEIMIAQAATPAVTTERQRLMVIYNRQGLRPLLAELRKPSTNAAVRAERQRLLGIYSRSGQAGLVADLRRPATPVAVATPTPTPMPTMEPMEEPTPYMTPTPTPMPRVTPTPAPMVTSAPGARPTPRAGVLATPTPTPTPEVVIIAPTPAPFIGIKAYYWGASDETVQNTFTTMNTPIVGAKLELLSLDPFNFGASYNSMMNAPTSNFWDVYARAFGVKVGYRREDLAAPGITSGIHSNNIIAGLVFGVPIINDTLMFDFDITGGYTLDGLPIVGVTQAPNRMLLDGTAALRFQPFGWMNVFAGYRSYLFGTQEDMMNLVTFSNARSAYFGSFQGPLAGVGFRF